MSWYVHPSKQLRDDELPPELVVTNRDGSVEQVYVPYNASDQLEAENAKLREERDMYRDLVGCMVHPDIPDQLEAENAKLRELVRDVWRFTGAACKKYPRLFDPAAQGGQMVQLNAIDAFEQRMRELGVDA